MSLHHFIPYCVGNYAWLAAKTVGNFVQWGTMEAGLARGCCEQERPMYGGMLEYPMEGK